ncbi:hypothetical protein FB451DRAFT_1453200 [Mycena latifolia]|nr:hypothetical protein FB451DRAFT_1453200 [Mycena latifolia]
MVIMFTHLCNPSLKLLLSPRRQLGLGFPRIPGLKAPLSTRWYGKRPWHRNSARQGVSTKLRELDRPVTKILPYNPYDPYWEVYKDWYTSPLVKRPWSCDWSQWCGVDWFAHNTIEAFYNTGFNIPGKIEPLAFFEAGAGATWFFTANLMYYFYHDERDVVLRFERAFSSHDEFFVWEHREWNKRHCTWTSEIRRCAPRVPLTTRLPLPSWLRP